MAAKLRKNDDRANTNPNWRPVSVYLPHDLFGEVDRLAKGIAQVAERPDHHLFPAQRKQPHRVRTRAPQTKS